MAENSPILEAHEWFINSKKIFVWTIQGEGDISGWNMEFVFKKSATEDAYLLRKDTAGGGLVVLSGPARTVQLTLQPTDTSGIEPVNGSYGLRRVDSGNELLLAYGDAMLQQAAAP